MEKCFDDAVSLAIWQEGNCFKCKKAVFYNSRLGKMPKYKCALQRDIEAEAADGTSVTERTLQLVCKDKRCPLIHPTEEEHHEEVLDFSKNSLDVEVKMPVKKDEKPKSEPIVMTKEQEQLRDQMIEYNFNIARIATEAGLSEDEVKKLERSRRERFAMDELCPKLTMTEDEFVKSCRESVEKRLNTFTFEENCMISFVPVAMNFVIFDLALKCCKFCADKKISETKKLSRAIKELHADYFSYVRKDMAEQRVELLKTEMAKWLEDNAYDFQILYWQCRNDLLKIEPKEKYIDLHAMVMQVLLLISTMKEHNNKMQELLFEKMHEKKVAFADIHLMKLGTLMDGFLPKGIGLKMNSNMTACKAILKKNIKTIMDVTKMFD